MKLKNIETNIDTSTGEVLTISKSFSIRVENTEQFYMTYIGSIGHLHKLRSATDLILLSKLCCIAEYNTGVANFTSSKRKEWCIELDIKTQQISNSLSRLIKLKLISGSGGTFQINPCIFWKGDNEKRRELMRNSTIKITFEIE